MFLHGSLKNAGCQMFFFYFLSMMQEKSWHFLDNSTEQTVISRF